MFVRTLFSLYFPEVDGAGHRFGPESPEAEKSVQLVDNAIGNLVKKVNQLGLKNMIPVSFSDHGMIKVDKENPLSIPEMLLIKKDLIFIIIKPCSEWWLKILMR